MHTGHRGEGVYEFAHHPHAGGFAVVHAVEEAVFRRQHAGRHGRVDGEDDEGEQVCEREGAADGSKSVMRGRDVVVPGDEADGAGDVDKGVEVIEAGEERLMAVDEPGLEVDFAVGK